jgi:hypothetical protein
MSLVSIFFTALFYLSLVIFLVGMARKIYQYWITPTPLKIPTAPTPLTQTGVVMRLAREVVLFESLFKSNKWTWLFDQMVLKYNEYAQWQYDDPSNQSAQLPLQMLHI